MWNVVATVFAVCYNSHPFFFKLPMLYKWPIIGHEKQLEKLEEDLASDNLSHAYLFVGPDKVGKFLVAKTLAGVLQCPENYCRRCPVCLQLEKGVHLDTINMRDDGESIKVDEMRSLVSTLHMSTQSNYKIVLLDNIGRMTNDSANCFLKTLEEPPKKTLILMTATNVHGLLPTIVSRSRVMKFPAIAEQKLEQKINDMSDELGIDATEEMLERACMLSLGRPGKAIELLRDKDVMTEYLRFYNDIRSFFRDKDLTKRFMYVQGLTDKEVEARERDTFLEIFLHIVRSFLNAKIRGGDVDDDDFPEIIRFSRADLLNLVHKIEETRHLLGRNVNTKLALEDLMLSF